jgi:hypothetical protein
MWQQGTTASAYASIPTSQFACHYPPPPPPFAIDLSGAQVLHTPKMNTSLKYQIAFSLRVVLSISGPGSPLNKYLPSCHLLPTLNILLLHLHTLHPISLRRLLLINHPLTLQSLRNTRHHEPLTRQHNTPVIPQHPWQHNCIPSAVPSSTNPSLLNSRPPFPLLN